MNGPEPKKELSRCMISFLLFFWVFFFFNRNVEQTFKKSYVNHIMPILGKNIENCIFLDECHFISMDQWRDHGWYDKGSMPLSFRQNLWNKQSCSLLMAIGYNGPVHYMIRKHANSRGVNSRNFIDFLLFLHRNLPKVRLFYF